MERRGQGRGQLNMRVRDRTQAAVFEALTHAFERTAELQVHRSRRGGLADGHLQSQVAARNRGGCSGLSSPARKLNKARQLIRPPRLAIRPTSPEGRGGTKGEFLFAPLGGVLV